MQAFFVLYNLNNFTVNHGSQKAYYKMKALVEQFSTICSLLMF